MPYRYLEAIEALRADPKLPLFIDESEMTADELWRLNIPSIVFGRSLKNTRIKKLLCGYESRLVICVDRDLVGVKKAERYLNLFPMARSLKPYPESDFWLPEWLPKSGGQDVRDWIQEMGGEDLDSHQIRDRIFDSIEPRNQEETSGLESNSDENVKNLLRPGTDIPPQVFDDSLHIPLLNLASNLGLTIEPLVVCLLPLLASRLKCSTRLEIDPATNYFAPPVVWAGLVGDSGTLKTPILRVLTSPLDDLQKEEFESFQSTASAYELDLQVWKSLKKETRENTSKPTPPELKDLYFDDFTIEAIAHSISHYPNEGYLINIDELAVFLKSMDAYRGGRGGDRQRWLTSYSGNALKVNRKSSVPIYIRRTSISIVGGIQPSVLEKQILDDPTADDGLWARFIWCRLPMIIPPGISDRPQFDLSQFLRGLYHSLNQIESNTYGLTTEAKALWNSWNQEIGELIKLEPSGILRATYPKLKEMAARIALVLHITNAKLRGKSIESKLSDETLSKSIQLTRWLMGQTRSLYCEIGISDNSKAARIIKFVNRYKGCGWITARIVRDWWPEKKKPLTEVCRDFMSTLVRLGYARDNDLEIDNKKYSIEILGPLVPRPLK